MSDIKSGTLVGTDQFITKTWNTFLLSFFEYAVTVSSFQDVGIPLYTEVSSFLGIAYILTIQDDIEGQNLKMWDFEQKIGTGHQSCKGEMRCQKHAFYQSISIYFFIFFYFVGGCAWLVSMIGYF